MIVSKLIEVGIRELADAEIEYPELDVQLLLGHILGKTRTYLYLYPNEEVPEAAVEEFEKLLFRRKKKEPVAYILGYREFWSREYLVNPSVLIPRDETEFMIEKVLEIVRPFAEDGILDLCCGSGVIGCVLAQELKKKVVCADISSAALEVTAANAEKQNISHLIQTVKTDLFHNLKEKQFFLVVTNPPYISDFDLDHNLDSGVRDYEPRLALDGGKKGLEIIERITAQADLFMKRGGHLFMEVGADQGKWVKRMFQSRDCWGEVSLYRDYAGRDRVVHGVKR